MFTGVLTALVTPFRDGKVDEKALRDLVSWQMECGIDGFVPCGTTGEAATMSFEERMTVIRTVVDEVKGKAPVIAGVGTNSTDSTIKAAKAAKEAGVDGLLVVCPYYNKPTQAGLEAHFRAVFAAVDLPVVIYNIPGRTGIDLQLPTFLKLADEPNFVGVKEATGSVVRAAELVAKLEGRAAVLAGDDPLYFPVLAVGGLGIISASAGVAPREMVSVLNDWKAGEVERARDTYLKLLDLFSTLFLESNPGPAKAALHLMGKIAPEIRLPLVWPAPETVEQIRSALNGLEG